MDKRPAASLACDRANHSGMPVTAVALDLGYASPGAFSAMFRRALGIAHRAFTARGGLDMRAVTGP